MSSAFEVFRILIVYGEVVQQLPLLAVAILLFIRCHFSYFFSIIFPYSLCSTKPNIVF